MNHYRCGLVILMAAEKAEQMSATETQASRAPNVDEISLLIP
jgi:hypothetical protein